MSLQFPIRACWMKRGEQKRLPAADGPHDFQHLVGAYNWRTDHVYYLPTLLKNSLTFIAFLEYLLLTVYPDQLVVIVIDNSPITVAPPSGRSSVCSSIVYAWSICPSTVLISISLSASGVILRTWLPSTACSHPCPLS